MMNMNSKTVNYEVRSYDSWYSEEEGWWVNDSWQVGEIEVGEDADDLEVISALIDARFLKPSARDKVKLDWFELGGGEVVDEETEEPLLGLIAIN